MITEFTECHRPQPACTRLATRRAIALLVAAGLVDGSEAYAPAPQAPRWPAPPTRWPR